MINCTWKRSNSICNQLEIDKMGLASCNVLAAKISSLNLLKIIHIETQGETSKGQVT